MIHFTEADWERIERDWAAWWAHELERPLFWITETVPTEDLPTLQHFHSNYPLDMPADDVIDIVDQHMDATRWHGDAMPKWWPNFGPGIQAGFTGAKVNSVPETVWFTPDELLPIGELDLDYEADNVWWERVQNLTRAAVERWGGLVQVGHTDLGGNLDILASFRETQNLLYDLMDAPDEVERLVGEITALWLRYYDELDAIIRPTCRGTSNWDSIWSSGTNYMLQCDFSYMISPEMFERFVMPDLAACCAHLDHGFFHQDGPGQIVHTDLLISLKDLDGIQWQPGAGQPLSGQGWLEHLKHIKDGGKLMQLYVDAEGTLTIAKEIGARGIMFHLAEPMDAETADAFIKEVCAASID
jgi:5-methyltetrahydrofolate--homocysteine methyltransferase